MDDNNSNNSSSLPNVKANWKFSSETSELFGKLIHTDDIEEYESNNEKKSFVVFEKVNDEEKYFELTIEFDYVIEWTSIDIFSTARTVELYTSKEKEYGQTCRFTEKIGEDSAYQYNCVCLDSNQSEKRLQRHSNFTLKFLSLDYPERSARQTKICVSAIIFHGKRRGEKLSNQRKSVEATESESKQFSGAMNSLMSDPRMLMNLMNGMNNPTAKQMSMIVGQIMPFTKTIDNVAAERKVEQEEVPKPNLPKNIETLSNIPENPRLLNEFKSKEDLKNYINDCVDERMKHWEERMMNKMMGEIGKFASPLLQGLGNPFAMFRQPTIPSATTSPQSQTNTSMPTMMGDISGLLANMQNINRTATEKEEIKQDSNDDKEQGQLSNTTEIHNKEQEDTPELD